MTRIEIYNKMKELGMKHYILSASVIGYNGKRGWTTDNLMKCHYTDESFDKEISKLEAHGYNFFDVIHLHA